MDVYPSKTSKTRAESIPGGRRVQKRPQKPNKDFFDKIRGYGGMDQIGGRVVKMGQNGSKMVEKSIFQNTSKIRF